MAAQNILIVDDEQYVRESLVDLLDSEGYRGLSAASASEALRILGSDTVDAVVTDLQMPAGDGLRLLGEIRESGSEIPVVLLTGVGTIADAVAAMKGGAYDFIQKPVEPEQFMLVMRRAIEHRDLLTEVRYLRHAVEDLQGPAEMVGASVALRAVQALIGQVAPSDATVLITGESGTGKELVAREIHLQSARSAEKLVTLNCAAVSETLFESEFFGHRRGSFTGAMEDRVGRFAEAESGTLVLDEIGTLKPEMQAKLLRVLETGEYQVVGESRTRIADVRVIAITNENLEARVRSGAFRKDLYYRLNIFPIVMAPLRERRADIPPLAEHFLTRVRATPVQPRNAKGIRLSPESLEVLCAYDWPGNVRELRNVIERAMILSGAEPPRADLLRRILGIGSAAETKEAASAAEDLHIRERVDALERELILTALERASGKKRDAARLLGIDPRNLAYYLRKHDLGEQETGKRGP